MQLYHVVSLVTLGAIVARRFFGIGSVFAVGGVNAESPTERGGAFGGAVLPEWVGLLNLRSFLYSKSFRVLGAGAGWLSL